MDKTITVTDDELSTIHDGLCALAQKRYEQNNLTENSETQSPINLSLSITTRVQAYEEKTTAKIMAGSSLSQSDVDQLKSAGHVAIVYPRKKQVVVDGFKYYSLTV